jgi:hypothetical protein
MNWASFSFFLTLSWGSLFFARIYTHIFVVLVSPAEYSLGVLHMVYIFDSHYTGKYIQFHTTYGLEDDLLLII